MGTRGRGLTGKSGKLRQLWHHARTPEAGWCWAISLSHTLFAPSHQVASEVRKSHQNSAPFSFSTPAGWQSCFLEIDLFVCFIRMLILIHKTIKSSVQVEIISRVCTLSVEAAIHLTESEYTESNLKGQVKGGPLPREA